MSLYSLKPRKTPKPKYEPVNQVLFEGGERLMLPAHSLFDKQQDPPHRRRIVTWYGMDNGTRVELSTNWPGTRWFVTASKAGYRMSTSIATSSRKTAARWEKAINGGHVGFYEGSEG